MGSCALALGKASGGPKLTGAKPTTSLPLMVRLPRPPNLSSATSAGLMARVPVTEWLPRYFQIPPRGSPRCLVPFSLLCLFKHP